MNGVALASDMGTQTEEAPPMTAQQPDILVIDGEEVPLFSAPLDEYIGRQGEGWPFASARTSNWRGYVATWKIEDDVLFLTALRGWIATKPIRASHPLDIRIGDNMEALPPAEDPVERARNPPAVPLDFVFPGAGERVAATWFSGVLRVPRGQLLQYEHMGFGSIYEEDLLVTIEQGRVTKRETVDRRAEFAIRLATTLVEMAAGGASVRAEPDRKAMWAALMEFSQAAAAEDLESPRASTWMEALLKFADRLGFRELQTAIRVALKAGTSGEHP